MELSKVGVELNKVGVELKTENLIHVFEVVTQ